MSLTGAIQIRFVSGGGWDSRLIEYWTRCDWSHAEALCDGRTFGAMLKGGACWRSLDDPSYRNIKRSATVNISSRPEQEDCFWRFLAAQEGKPYDKAAILAFSPLLRLFVRDRNWQDDRKWFCSELQLAALCSAGILRVPKDTPITSYSPRDLWVMLGQV